MAPKAARWKQFSDINYQWCGIWAGMFEVTSLHSEWESNCATNGSLAAVEICLSSLLWSCVVRHLRSHALFSDLHPPIRHHVRRLQPEPGPGPGPDPGPDPSCSRIQCGPGAQPGVQRSSILHVWILRPAASAQSSHLVCYWSVTDILLLLISCYLFNLFGSWRRQKWWTSFF